MDLANKTVIVTGAGTGIGRATALKLASKGAKVVINYNKSEKNAEDVIREIKKLGGKAFSYKADVSNEDEVNSMVSKVIEIYGTIDGLVNNASITAQIPLDDLNSVTDQIWNDIFNVNVKGMFTCTKAVVPYMKQQKSGVIINMGSVAGVTGIGSSIPYAASKSAIHIMTKSLAIALAPEIRVNAIAPGAVNTRWWAGNEDKMYNLAGNLPLEKISTPDEIADCIIFQMTQKSLTGQTFIIDNGQTL
ncbi:3-oxoacyl-[acyl-carrier protein] reductase [Ureibacillus xyleni]|uniref:3-oxoacyl-[acyl-carrier protein] reductase n=1 Tax=Ureibacillus xyleni TaxID=614648 RepID=A0A285RCX5_9BACL|nr:SDR family NAD(P)-dependent oxidoreductase [Ureibacillus xyleni]SOB91963.1 3-oxoacyl-[acyl-carrier protein] reductase [Ureibacillus xyleni]